MRFFGGWRRQTPQPEPRINIRIRERDAALRADLEQVAQNAQRLAEIRDALARGHNVNLTRNYVDATAFGDVNRTYVTGATTVTATDVNGTIVQTWDWPTDGTIVNTFFTAPDITPEEAERRAEAARIEARRRVEAIATSAELLQRFITKDEWKALQAADGYLQIKGKHITYRISRYGNVETTKPYKGRFCVSVYDRGVPHWDAVLTMKLWIEHREEEFLAEANWSGKGINLGKIDITGKVARSSPYYTYRDFGERRYTRGVYRPELTG